MHLDVGAIALYLVFAAVVVFLVYLMFDLSIFYSTVKTQKYERGHPRHEELRSARGVFKIEEGELVFREPETAHDHFTIPISSVGRVLKRDAAAGLGRKVFSNIVGAVDERDYIQVEYQQDGQWHKVMLSSHKASKASDEAISEILAAKCLREKQFKIQDTGEDKVL
jgi:hypothetical protein